MIETSLPIRIKREKTFNYSQFLNLKEENYLTLRKTALKKKIYESRKKYSTSKNTAITLDSNSEIKPINTKTLDSLNTYIKTKNTEQLKNTITYIRKYLQQNDKDEVEMIKFLFKNDFLSTSLLILKSEVDITCLDELFCILINIFAISTTEINDIYYEQILSQEFIDIFSSFIYNENNSIVLSTIWLVANTVADNRKWAYFFLTTHKDLYNKIIDKVKIKESIDFDILNKIVYLIAESFKIPNTSELSHDTINTMNKGLNILLTILPFRVNKEIKNYCLLGIINLLDIKDNLEFFFKQIDMNNFDLLTYIFNEPNIFIFEDFETYYDDLNIISNCLGIIKIFLFNYSKKIAESIVKNGVISFILNIWRFIGLIQIQKKCKKEISYIKGKVRELILNICQIGEDCVLEILRSKVKHILKEPENNLEKQQILIILCQCAQFENVEIANLLYTEGFIRDILSELKLMMRINSEYMNNCIKVLIFFIDSYTDTNAKETFVIEVKSDLKEILLKNDILNISLLNRLKS